MNIHGRITAASYPTNGMNEDRSRLTVRFQPTPGTTETDSSNPPGRRVLVRTTKPSELHQTIAIDAVKVRFRKLSNLMGEDMIATLDDKGAIVSLDYAP